MIQSTQEARRVTWVSRVADMTLIDRVVIAAVIILAAAVRLWHINWGLPLLLHPDEWSQSDVAWRIAGGDLNPHFFRYSTGYMYLLAPVLKIADILIGPLSQPDRYELSRIATALLGALTVWVVWQWSKLLIPAGWALGTALVLALLPSHVIHSHYATVDIPLTLMVCVSGYAMTRLALATTEQRRWSFLSAVSVGLTIGIKYTAAVLVIPLAVLIITSLPPQQHLKKRARFILIGAGLGMFAAAITYSFALPQIIHLAERLTTDGHLEQEYLSLLQQILWGLFVASAAFLLLAGPWADRWTARVLTPLLGQSLVIVVVVFACTSPFIFIDYRHSLVDILYEYRHAKIGAEAHFAEGTNIAHRAQSWENAAFYLAQLIGDFGIMLLLSLAGIASLIRRHLRVAIAIGLLPALLLGVAITSGNTADRYLLPIYPALCVLGGIGVFELCRRVPRASLWGACGFAIISILIASALSTQLTLFALPDTRSLAHEWIAGHLPAGSRIVNENYTQTPSLSDLPVTELLANRNFEPATRWDGQADYLLLGAAGTVALPDAIEGLTARYGPPIMKIAANREQNQGVDQFIFRISR